MIGWRGRIGLIIPSTNTTIEYEYTKMASCKRQVEMHLARKTILHLLERKNGLILLFFLNSNGICYLRLDGQPLTNTDIKEGMNVAVIGLKAPDRWRVPTGFNVFRRALEAMGYKEGYKKIEKLNKK